MSQPSTRQPGDTSTGRLRFGCLLLCVASTRRVVPDRTGQPRRALAGSRRGLVGEAGPGQRGAMVWKHSGSTMDTLLPTDLLLLFLLFVSVNKPRGKRLLSDCSTTTLIHEKPCWKKQKAGSRTFAAFFLAGGLRTAASKNNMPQNSKFRLRHNVLEKCYFQSTDPSWLLLCLA